MQPPTVDVQGAAVGEGNYHCTKGVLANVTMFSYPQGDAPIANAVDASRVAVGVVLEQLSWQKLADSSDLQRGSIMPPTRPSFIGLPILASHLTGAHAQFTSKLWTAIATLLSTKLHHTTAYILQSKVLGSVFIDT